MKKKKGQRSRPGANSRRTSPRRMLLVLATAVIGSAGWWWLSSQWSQEAAGLANADAFRPTVENARSVPGAPPPRGMAWIPGGEFSMGAGATPDMNAVGMQATTDSRPIHRVYVDGFWMD